MSARTKKTPVETPEAVVKAARDYAERCRHAGDTVAWLNIRDFADRFERSWQGAVVKGFIESCTAHDCEANAKLRRIRRLIDEERATADAQVKGEKVVRMYTLHDCGIQRRALLDRFEAILIGGGK